MMLILTVELSISGTKNKVVVSIIDQHFVVDFK